MTEYICDLSNREIMSNDKWAIQRLLWLLHEKERNSVFYKYKRLIPRHLLYKIIKYVLKDFYFDPIGKMFSINYNIDKASLDNEYRLKFPRESRIIKTRNKMFTFCAMHYELFSDYDIKIQTLKCSVYELAFKVWNNVDSVKLYFDIGRHDKATYSINLKKNQFVRIL